MCTRGWRSSGAGNGKGWRVGALEGWALGATKSTFSCCYSRRCGDIIVLLFVCLYSLRAVRTKEAVVGLCGDFARCIHDARTCRVIAANACPSPVWVGMVRRLYEVLAFCKLEFDGSVCAVC